MATRYPLVTLLEELQRLSTPRHLYDYVLLFCYRGLARIEVVVPEVDDLVVRISAIRSRPSLKWVVAADSSA